MEESWVKLYRKITEWEWYTDSHMVNLFLHLLIKANSSDKSWRGVIVKKGQLITNLNALSIETGISKQTVRTCLNRLEKTREINTQTNTRFTLITICKFDSYQDNSKVSNTQTNTQINTPLTHDQHATNTQLTHTKEYKNIRKITVSKETAMERDEAGAGFSFDVKDYFNKTLDDNGSMIPRIRSKFEGQRKAWLNARIKEYGLEGVKKVITLASQSQFLNGGGNKGFVASFDWIMRPNNFPKVLDGNYNNKTNNQKNGTENYHEGSRINAADERINRAYEYAEVAADFRRESENTRINAKIRKPAIVPDDFFPG
jgi:hypothetical protein